MVGHLLQIKIVFIIFQCMHCQNGVQKEITAIESGHYKLNEDCLKNTGFKTIKFHLECIYDDCFLSSFPDKAAVEMHIADVINVANIIYSGTFGITFDINLKYIRDVTFKN